MEFSLTENGLNSDIIRSNRKDWTLAHDVALLKHLENFSLRFISKAEDAIKSLEEFECNINRVYLNIKAISHKCQSLADKQFIEHRVQEDDVTAYAKKKEVPMKEKSGSNKSDLSTALTSCLTALHSKYEKIHLQSGSSNDSISSQIVITPVSRYDDRFLPPFLGTEDFFTYYNKTTEEDINEKISKGNNMNSQFSDKQSMHDSSSMCSSNFTFDDEEDDFNVLRSNKNLSIHSMPCDYPNNYPAQSNDEDSISNADLPNQDIKRSLSSNEDIIGQLTKLYNSRSEKVRDKDSTVKLIIPPKLSEGLNEASTVPDTDSVGVSDYLSTTNANDKNNKLLEIVAVNDNKKPTIFDDSDSDDLFSSDRHVPFSQRLFADKLSNDNDGSNLFNNTDNLFNKQVGDNKNPKLEVNKSFSNVPDRINSSSSKPSSVPKNDSSIIKTESRIDSSKKLNNNMQNNKNSSPSDMVFPQIASSQSHLSKDSVDNAQKSIFSSLQLPPSKNKDFSLFSDSDSSDDDLFSSKISSNKVLKTKDSSRDDVFKVLSESNSNSFFHNKPSVNPKLENQFHNSSNHPEKKTPLGLEESLAVSKNEIISDSESPMKTPFLSAESKTNVQSTKLTSGKLAPERYLHINPKSLMGGNIKAPKQRGTDAPCQSDSFLNNVVFPSYQTEILTNVVKSRAKITSKRRPPSRKHLREISSTEESYGTRAPSANEVERNTLREPLIESSVLSPSTDEEDLFTVPHSMPPREVSCSNLFSDSSLLSPGTSVDSQINNNENDKKKHFWEFSKVNSEQNKVLKTDNTSINSKNDSDSPKTVSIYDDLSTVKNSDLCEAFENMLPSGDYQTTNTLETLTSSDESNQIESMARQSLTKENLAPLAIPEKTQAIKDSEDLETLKDSVPSGILENSSLINFIAPINPAESLKSELLGSREKLSTKKDQKTIDIFNDSKLLETSKGSKSSGSHEKSSPVKDSKPPSEEASILNDSENSKLEKLPSVINAESLKNSLKADLHSPVPSKTLFSSNFLHENDKNKNVVKNNDKLFSTEKNSLFNDIDLEDDDDYLFSDIKPISSKLPSQEPESTSNSTSNNKNVSISQLHSNPILFNDLFSDSDGEDDLFNVKKTTGKIVNNNNNSLSNPENPSVAAEDSGKSKSSLTKQTEFTDPLGIHIQHQTD